MPVHELLKKLFKMYGRVTPQKLQDQEDMIRRMTYDPVNPIDGIFTAIDELAHYTDAADTPYSQPQIVNMGYIILNKTGFFRRWILDWNNKPTVQKIWMNFKEFFREAHQQLRETTSLQQQQSTFQANAVQEILSELRNELRTAQVDTASVQPSLENLSTVTPDTAASTISDLKSEVSTLKEMIHHMSTRPNLFPPQQLPPWTVPPNYFLPHPMYCNQVTPQNEVSSNPEPKQEKRRIFYCWTHGACLHSSDRCLHRAPGHQPTATFKNRMGGSTKNVRMPAQVQPQATN